MAKRRRKVTEDKRRAAERKHTLVTGGPSELGGFTYWPIRIEPTAAPEENDNADR